MRVYKEMNLQDFDFWAGAKETVKYLDNLDMELIQEILEDCYHEGMSETELNDFFWFNCDGIAECLGYADFEEMMEDRKAWIK